MQGVQRVLDVLEAVASHQPAGVGELSRIVGLPKSTVQRHLQALAEAGWIRPEKGEYTKWTLTARALMIGQRGSREGNLREVALEPMRVLRDVTEETVTLQVPSSLTEMVQIERVDSQQAVRTYVELGQVQPMHTTSGGLAYLAACDPDTVDNVLAAGLARMTPATVTDPKKLTRLLKEIRTQGYAINVGMNRSGVCAVGQAIRSRDGKPVAAIGLSIPESRFTQDRAPVLGAQIADAIKIIEERL